MVIDGRDLAGQGVVETDVCIVGAGPAGLSVALELARDDVSVCVLESGEVEVDHEARLLLAGTTHSALHPHDHLESSRESRVGGTGNLWEVDVRAGHPFVRYALPDDIDFEVREPLRTAAWPFSRRSLDPFLSRAARLCGIPENGFALTAEHRAPLLLPEQEFHTKLFSFGPAAVFTEAARNHLEHSTTTTVALRSTAVELQLADDATRTESLLVATGGQTFRVRARFFVLAGGAFENARLLLLSRGLENEHDLVGRYLTDHPFVEVGLVTPHDANVFEESALYDQRQIGDSFAMGYLSPTREALARERLLNAALFLFPRPRAYGSSGVTAVRELGHRRGFDIASLRRAARVVAGVHDVVTWLHQRRSHPGIATDAQAGGWSVHPGLAERFSVFRLEAQLEQAPNPENRVTLGKARDRLGRPRLDLRWRWSDVDVESFERLESFLGRSIVASGLGTLRPTFGLSGAFSPHHAMGTTRMHEDPAQGVVDANCRVHEVENVFVAGSSVFPNSAGSGNPTLLIVVLSLRLSDHLRTLL